jgi:hypothetical protein
MLVLALLLPSQEEFFPLDEGAVWTYQTSAGRDHIRRIVGTERVGDVLCSVVRAGETEQHWLAGSKEGISTHRARGVTFERPALMIKFPLVKGDAWKGEAESAEGKIVYSFTNVGEEDVQVPAGRYRAFRLEWILEGVQSRSSGSTWLARGVGAVKLSYVSGGVETVLELARFESPRRVSFPLGRGFRWVYKTEIDDVDRVTEVTGTEKVGEVECFVVEYRSQDRVLRREWLEAASEGARIHKLQRGKSTLAVEKPFFKIKNDLVKDAGWGGEAQASELPPRYSYRVVGEEEVEVPVGRHRAWKLHVRIDSGDLYVFEGHEWYARGVGLLKSDITITSRNESYTTTAELKEFTRGR